MSLKGKKKKKMTFSIEPDLRYPDDVVMTEQRDNGEIARYGFPRKNLDEKPIDLLTHEFSENAVWEKIQEEDKKIRPERDRVTLYKGSKYREVTVPHHMVSHHTESGIRGPDGNLRTLTSDEYIEEVKHAKTISQEYPKFPDIKREFDKRVSEISKLNDAAQVDKIVVDTYNWLSMNKRHLPYQEFDKMSKLMVDLKYLLERDKK
jgi:hypothetical protein